MSTTMLFESTTGQIHLVASIIALLSGTIVLAAGMITKWVIKPVRSYISLHFSFMYWSIMGLYAAFFAETFVHLPSVVIIDGVPNSLFYIIVGISPFLTMAMGGWVFIENIRNRNLNPLNHVRINSY